MNQRTLRPTRRLFIAASALALMLLNMGSAYAKDLSLPYRNYPGFTCHHWNSAGECTDFSYSEGGSYGNYYGPNGTFNTYVPNSYHYAPSAYRNTTYYKKTTNTYRSGDCYDSYGRYNSSYCDSYNSRYYDDYSDCYNRYDRYSDCDVSVRVTGSPNPVYQGDLLTYSIYIRNDSNSDRTVDVRATIDRDTIFHSASDSGRSYGSTEARWDRLLVRARSSKTLSLTVRLDTNARDGDTVRVTVYAGGDSDSAETNVRDDRYRYPNTGSNYRSRGCYDRYGRYNSSYCDDYNYNNCDRYDYGCGDVSVRASGPSEAGVGELVTYTVTLRNDSSQGRTVDVRATVDRDLTFYSASDGGRERNADEVRWDSIYVSPRSSRSVSVSARIDGYARRGDILSFIANADGDEDEVTTRIR